MTTLRPRRLVGLVFAVLLLAACTGEGLPDVTIDLPDVTRPEVTVPDATVPDATVPEATVPSSPDSGESEDPTSEGEVPLWVWVVLGLLLVGLFSWIGARSGSRRSSADAVTAAAVSDWQASARQAYADSRWLYDQLTPTLATWRGEAQFKAQTGVGTGSSERDATWWEAQTRLEGARDSLYKVEASQPNSQTATAARSLVASLNSTKASVDRLAAAHLSVKSVGGDNSEQTQLEELRAAELQATDALGADRARLQQAITTFSGVL